MMFFDNVDILTAAPVMIDDITISGIEYQRTETPNAIEAGSFLARNRAASRTVTAIFALLEEDTEARHAALMALSAWAKSDKEYKLQIPGYPNHHLMALCAEKPSPTIRKWWDGKLKFVFRCVTDPYWIDNTEKTAPCGSSIIVCGSAPPLMKIRRTFAASSSNISFSLDGRNLKFQTVPMGDLEVDLNSQTATVFDGVDLFNAQDIALNSRWPIPRTGEQVIQGSGTVAWQERYE